MRRVSNWLIIIYLWLMSGCGSSDKKGETVKFDRFDLFQLKGESIIGEIGTNKEYAEVMFKNSFPVLIRFVLPKREVTLHFKDSFMVKQNQPVYVYTSSNFHGGTPGRQKIYTSHHVEYEDQIYISLSDTIACKSFDIPTIDDYDYQIHILFKLQNDSIKDVQGRRNIAEDKELSRENLYLNWLELARQNFPNDSYPNKLLDRIPPK